MYGEETSGLGQFYGDMYRGLGLFAVSPLWYNGRMLEEKTEGELFQKILWVVPGLPVSIALTVAVTAPIALVCMALMTLAAPVLFAGDAWSEGFDTAIRGEDYSNSL